MIVVEANLIRLVIPEKPQFQKGVYMPIQVRPLKITCKSCGWSMVVRPHGDRIVGPTHCPRCGSADQILATAGPLDRLKLSVASLIRFVLKK
jgi:Zn finger protein HypA/HybF involved in hydrogenase expression